MAVCMDQRLSERIPLQMQVLVHFQGVPVVQCSAHDISAEGMFLLGDTLGFEINSDVEVELLVGDGSNPDIVNPKLSATVVHRAGSGIGVMFTASLTEILNTFKTLGDMQKLGRVQRNRSSEQFENFS